MKKIKSPVDAIIEGIPISRIMYKTKCKSSRKIPEIGYSGKILGYPENDEHYRARIKKSIDQGY